MTVQELIETLEECDPAAQVRIAAQPSYPMEYRASRVEEVFLDDATVVYIAEGGQIGYLPGKARDAVGF